MGSKYKLSDNQINLRPHRLSGVKAIRVFACPGVLPKNKPQPNPSPSRRWWGNYRSGAGTALRSHRRAALACEQWRWGMGAPSEAAPQPQPGREARPGPPRGSRERAGWPRAGVNRRALGTRETSRAAAKLSPRRPLSAPGRPDPDSHPLILCRPRRSLAGRPQGARAGPPARSAIGAACTGAALWQCFQGHRRRPARSLPPAPPTARSGAAAALGPPGRLRTGSPRRSAREQLDRTAHLGPGESLPLSAEDRERARGASPAPGIHPPRDSQRGRISSAPPAPLLAFISGSCTAPGRQREPWRPLPTCGAWGPAGPALPGPPTARGLAAPRGAYRCSYRSPGSRAAAAAGPGRPPLLLPASRCSRRGLARSAARTMGSGPRWEGRRENLSGRRAAPPPTPKSCRPPPSRRRSAQPPPPAVGWKPRAWCQPCALGPTGSGRRSLGRRDEQQRRRRPARLKRCGRDGSRRARPQLLPAIRPSLPSADAGKALIPVCGRGALPEGRHDLSAAATVRSGPPGTAALLGSGV